MILTDQTGLYERDPRKHPDAHARRARRAPAIPRCEAMAGGAGSAIGLGGMLTKVLAAKRAARSGAHTVIASGREPDVLLRLAAGEAIGTQLIAERATLAARKQWLADHLQVRGQLVLDAGAVKALKVDGKSLLPIGVVDALGEFERGEVVSCLDEAQREIARGLVNYSAPETRRILRTPSGEIEAKLGYVDEPELIHRDNLVLLVRPSCRQIASNEASRESVHFVQSAVAAESVMPRLQRVHAPASARRRLACARTEEFAIQRVVMRREVAQHDALPFGLRARTQRAVAVTERVELLLARLAAHAFVSHVRRATVVLTTIV